MSKGTILAVDDDVITLNILSDFLEDSGYEVVTAKDGQEALDILEADSDRFDAVVLDWIMPRMDGLSLLNTLNADMRFITLPVIMQTSVSDREHVSNAIGKGAYYYVTKPYEHTVLVKVVQAALEKFRQFRDVMSWGVEAIAGLALLQRGEFRLRSLQEGRMVANLIADLAERNVPVVNGMMELITNAIENGNLGITGKEKSVYVVEGRWSEEVVARIFLPENMDKFVTVTFEIVDDVVEVDIKDQGTGFQWEPYLELDESRAYEVHGRGIAMAKAYSFDTIEYLENGTRVHVTFAAA